MNVRIIRTYTEVDNGGEWLNTCKTLDDAIVDAQENDWDVIEVPPKIEEEMLREQNARLLCDIQDAAKQLRIAKTNYALVVSALVISGIALIASNI